MTQQLGDTLRAARERKRMTQEKLAQVLEVDKRSVGNWERGETIPRNSLAVLADALDLNLEELTLLAGGLENAQEALREAIDSGTVRVVRHHAGRVMLDLPDEAIEGLDEIQKAEVVAAAEAAALERAARIRNR